MAKYLEYIREFIPHINCCTWVLKKNVLFQAYKMAEIFIGFRCLDYYNVQYSLDL